MSLWRVFIDSNDQVFEGLDLSGKTIAITGTTSGIGVDTARDLALKGAHIVMLNRNLEESEKQKKRFIEQKPNAQIDIVKCDLNSLDSVRKAGEFYLNKKCCFKINWVQFDCPWEFYNFKNQILFDNFEK
ncbi:hypothetical protein B9Z55_012262 [Caenorhabditis nigoni]|uniref:Uncharacterized protein n=1 Tax=Caenorhabditis nigoni TaxID=1611254 RepID=A0A2G5TWG2_9PELO|nr:hypothetical protein B9Z55_012262 [Caenorhabditis nigoni]